MILLYALLSMFGVLLLNVALVVVIFKVVEKWDCHTSKKKAKHDTTKS